jgi:putative endonuclease
VGIKKEIIMKIMYVYILECSDNSYYIGVTNDLERRFEEHTIGINRSCYTYTKRPVKIVCYEIFNDPISAIAFEKKIKGWNRKKKEALINKNYELLPKLSFNSKKNNAHSSTGSE